MTNEQSALMDRVLASQAVATAPAGVKEHLTGGLAAGKEVCDLADSLQEVMYAACLELGISYDKLLGIG